MHRRHAPTLPSRRARNQSQSIDPRRCDKHENSAGGSLSLESVHPGGDPARTESREQAAEHSEEDRLSEVSDGPEISQNFKLQSRN